MFRSRDIATLDAFFFFKKHSTLTFAICNVARHATYCWKAFED